MFIVSVVLFTFAALGGLVVSALATGPMGPAAAGSGPAEDGGFLWVPKIPSAHFLGGEVKPSVPRRTFTACKSTLHSMSEMLCLPYFLTCFSPVIFSCFATRWLWLLNQDDWTECAPHSHELRLWNRINGDLRASGL
jgi:hypothetical protein